MKILLTGGGSGGHFYPVIAVAEALERELLVQKIVGAKLYYASTTPYDPALLQERGLTFIPITSGKRRLYFSWRNILDLFKVAWGMVSGLWKVFVIYPDVVFAKGGYASFPVLVAARLLSIPVIIHESDSVPGRVQRWAAGFAKRIALSYPEAAGHLSEKAQKKVALTGQPIREKLLSPEPANLANPTNPANLADPATTRQGSPGPDFSTPPSILVLGGSQGARKINEVVRGAVPTLLDEYQVIHQVGEKNEEEFRALVQALLEDHPGREHYRIYGHLSTADLATALGQAMVVVTRAGSGLFEIAAAGKPAIVIPITVTNGDHQRQNAYAYARAGAGVVIEEANLTPSILAAEIRRLATNPEMATQMGQAARKLFKPEAAQTIAREIITLARHER